MNKMRSISLLLIIVSLMFLSTTSPAEEISMDELNVERTFIVTFNRDVINDFNYAVQCADEAGMKTIDTIEAVGILVVEPLEGVDVGVAISTLMDNPDVISVEQNHLIRTFFEPNDPLYEEQYGMQKIRVADAWEVEYGSSDVIVAIVDTGAKFNHPDLEGRFWTNDDEIPNNGIDDDGNGFVDDVHGYDFRGDGFLPPAGKEDSDPSDDTGHGTHCAGIVGAITNNAEGVVGVAPGVTIMPVRALGGVIGFGWESDILAAVVYAVDNGADVISMSYGGSTFTEADRVTYEYAHDAGVVLVAASGNSGAQGNPIMWPAAEPFTIAVGATNSFDGLAYFSSFGPHLETSAPGMNIMSTVCGWLGMGQDYIYMSGTSMACPHVSGLAGLLISQDPSRTRDEVRLMISSSTVDLGATGWDQKFGYGRIDALAALTMDEPDMTVPHLIMPPDGAHPFQSEAFGFKWSEVPDAAKYEIDAYFPSGYHYSVYESGTVFFPPKARWSGLEPGDYTWQVSALDANGHVISVSEPSIFTID